MPADEAAAAAVIRGATRFAAGVKLPEEDWARLRIVVEEVVMNAVKHGHPPASSSIAYGFAKGGGELKIRIADEGAPFDPRSDRQERSPDETAPEQEGGQGWPLIMSWCRIADYRRENGQNRLKLVLPLAAQATGDGN